MEDEQSPSGNVGGGFRIFEFDPGAYRAEYASRGYVHIRGGAGAEFLKYAIGFSEARLASRGTEELSRWQFAGKKHQILMEFPEESDFPCGLFGTVARVAGLDVERMMIGERHVKIYESVAEEQPPPHKDRLASEVTVGVGLKVPEDSRLVLFPDADLTVNPYQTTREWRDTRDRDQLPEAVTAGLAPVEIDMRPGDVVMFAGSSIYHERIRPANTWVLYMKFNAMRLDPIAEDPQTLSLRAESLANLRTKTNDQLLDARIELSPRLEKVTRNYSRLCWQEVIHGHIMGENPFVLNEEEFRALRVLDDRVYTVRECLIRMGASALDLMRHVPLFRRLGELGAIEIHD